MSAVPSVAEALDRVVRAAGGRLSLVDDSERYTFAALDEAVRRAESALYSLGLREGDRLAASLPNRAGLVVAFLAAQRLGAIWVGLAGVLSPREKQAILVDAGASMYLSSPALADEAAQLTLPALREIVSFDRQDSGSRFARELAQAQPRARRGHIDAHAPAAIAYTSGTTGTPKGAVHSQHNLMLMGAMARDMGLYPEDMPHGVMLPLTTLNLMVLVPLLTLQRGAPCVVLESARPLELARRVREERVGHFTAVPTVYHDLLTHPDVDVGDLVSLQEPEMGGANIPPALRELVRSRLGRDTCIGYGMTEAPATLTRTRARAPFSPGLCGHALPHVRIEIRGEDDASLAGGEVGEICVTPASEGPFAGLYTPMLGYWQNPGATREVLRGGRYYTGDLGRLDETGALFVLGRKLEVIVRGGATIYPAEVERVLHEDPAVAAAAVVGKPDARLGERVLAFVEATPGMAVDVEALRLRCAAALARYKVPESLVVVERLPRNAMGKIVKRALLTRL